LYIWQGRSVKRDNRKPKRGGCAEYPKKNPAPER
jgi:hypothetical protein